MDEYGRAAQLYDPIVGPALRSIHLDMLVPLLKAGTRSAADLCCGTGQFTGLAVKSGINTIGVDLSPAMLDVARTKRTGIQFIHADAAALPFHEGAFDGAAISFALHEKPISLAVDILRETRRIVRPGGQIVVADYRAPAPRSSPWTGLNIRLVERLAGKNHYRYFKRYMSGGGAHALFRQAGMSVELAGIHLNGWAGIFVAIS